VKTVCSDHLVLAVLDDDSIQPRKLPDEPTKSRYNRGWGKTR
jgi:hypothetical protein